MIACVDSWLLRSFWGVAARGKTGGLSWGARDWPGVTVICHADTFLALLAECQLMDEVPAGIVPSQQEQVRDIGNAHHERLEANFGGDFAVPVWAAFGHAETGDMQSSCSTDMGGTRPSSVMRHQGYALAETVFAVCSEDNIPLELVQQDRFPSGDESSASLQVAFARPNLQLMDSMESKAIETIIPSSV